MPLRSQEIKKQGLTLALLVLLLGLVLLSGTELSTTAATDERDMPGRLLSTSADCHAWVRVPSPNNGEEENVLSAVGVASPTDVWAVGYSKVNDIRQTLSMRWDGQQWRIMPSPNPGESDNVFVDVSALAPNDVWVLGSASTSQGARPFIYRWNGQGWIESRLPPVGHTETFHAISARASDDAWIVGSRYDGNRRTDSLLIMRYNGREWTLVRRNPGYDSDALYDVVSLSANEAWMVGYHLEGAGTLGLAYHYNGTEWTEHSPPGGGSSPILYGVHATATDDVWAVGAARYGLGRATQLINHWNGREWTRADVPDPSGEGNELFGVAASSSRDVWAVGYLLASARQRALVMRYDGLKWTHAFIGEEGLETTLSDVAVPQTGSPIAVGTYWSPSNNVRRTLVYSYISTCSPPTATPTIASPPTHTPAPVPTVQVPGANTRLFQETGKRVSGLFLDYWEKNGSLAQQGYPISELMGEISDLNRKPYTVQYFERAVFEYHPENNPPYNVLLSQLGTFRYKKKYPDGAPNQTANHLNGRYFPETGYWVGGKFLKYWQRNGGLPQQGYPISDEFVEVSDLNGKPYTVQYFERAVFEYHPENNPPYDVLLSQLGTFQYREKYSRR